MHATHSKGLRRPSEFKRFLVADRQGNVSQVTPRDYGQSPLLADMTCALLRQFVANEFSDATRTAAPPKHIAYMQQLRLVDYCDVSEKGHYKWYPKGVLVQRLLLDYAARLAQEWGAFEMKNPLVIRGDNNVVGELMGEFHERDYRVDGGRGICYLRYASDPLAFPFMQKVQFSYKQSPLKVYEEASCFRNEQQGEVSGLKRVRNFLMTDMHAACSSVSEARREFEWLCLRFTGLMNDTIAQGRWVLGWEGLEGFFEENRDWLIGLGRKMGVPAFFKLMPEMSHYYAIKNEFQAICEDGSNIQVGTVQWDIKDGPRFDIGFVDEQGRKVPCPVIIHASSFGSIERTLCAILEKIAIDVTRGEPPMLPLWLAPTQARILPLSSDHVAEAVSACETVTRLGVRADVDDRDGPLGRKIRDAGKEWIPYVAVLGDKERQSGRLSVTVRADGRREEMTIDSLATEIRDRRGAFPHRPLPEHVLLSQRPIFLG